MERFIPLFALAAFSVMAISSCAGGSLVAPAPKYKRVMIKTEGAESRGNKPLVIPRCVELEYGADQQVEWVTDKGLPFTVKFNIDDNPSPFGEGDDVYDGFNNKNNKSGPIAKDPGEKDKVYMYTIEVEGLVTIDPAVIIWR